jgi:hypothetical protein
LFGEPLAGAEGAAGESLATVGAVSEFDTLADAAEGHRARRAAGAHSLDERGTIYLSPTLSATSVPSVANFC